MRMRSGCESVKELRDTLQNCCSVGACSHCMSYSSCANRETNFVIVSKPLVKDAIENLGKNDFIPEPLYRKINSILTKAKKGIDIDKKEVEDAQGWLNRLRREAAVNDH